MRVDTGTAGADVLAGEVFVLKSGFFLVAPLLLAVATAYAAGQTVKVEGTYVSSTDVEWGDGRYQHIVIKRADGTLLHVEANHGGSKDATMPWPPSNPLEEGAPITIIFKAHIKQIVTAVRPLGKGPAQTGAITGEFVGLQQGDLGAYVLLKQKGKEVSLLAGFELLTAEQAEQLKGKRVEVQQEPDKIVRYYVSHSVAAISADQQHAREEARMQTWRASSAEATSSCFCIEGARISIGCAVTNGGTAAATFEVMASARTHIMGQPASGTTSINVQPGGTSEVAVIGEIEGGGTNCNGVKGCSCSIRSVALAY